MAEPERKPNSTPENPQGGVYVVTEHPDMISSVVGHLIKESQDDVESRGPFRGNTFGLKNWSIISFNRFDNKIFSSEETIIGGQHCDYDLGGAYFACNSTIQLSDTKRESDDRGYFSCDKTRIIKNLLIEKGLKVEGEKIFLDVDVGGIKVRISLGQYPTQEAEEEALKHGICNGDRRNRVYNHSPVNESVRLELISESSDRVSTLTLPVKFKSLENFDYIIQIYSKVYGILVNAIYQSEGINPPGIRINLNNNISFPISKHYIWERGGFYYIPDKPVSPYHEESNKNINKSSGWEGFEVIAGQDNAVTEAKKLVQAIKHPEIYQKRGVKIPKGILLSGPPGTGKTLLAKAIAKEAETEFLSVSGEEIVTMWYGESERNMQKVFDEANLLAVDGKKVIIFFDDIDTIAQSRNAPFINEASKRILGTILRNMDGLKANPGITILASTNRLEDLDVAIKRSGRFDKIIEMALPSEKGRVDIFKIHMEKAKEDSTEPAGVFSNDLDFDQIGQMTNGLSGADIANLINRVLEEKLTKETEGEPWTPVSTDEILDMTNKLIIERTEKVEVSFAKR